MSGKRNLLVGTLDLNRDRLTTPINNLILTAICLSAWMTTTVEAQFSGGAGTVGDPYLISTADDMQAIGLDSNHWDKHFKLMADINLLDVPGTILIPIGSWPIFSGIFDGVNHTISNLVLEESLRSYVGLFAISIGKIKNLGFINPLVDQFLQQVGAVVGYNKGVIKSCWVDGGLISGASEIV